MSNDLAGLVIRAVVGVVPLVIATLIRVRGPAGLVRNVDWNRVSDPLALGHFISLILSALGALIIADGIILYAFGSDPKLRDSINIVFAVLVGVLALAMLAGRLRYQDKPPMRKRNGSR
jgi:hypothetical protein